MGWVIGDNLIYLPLDHFLPSYLFAIGEEALFFDSRYSAQDRHADNCTPTKMVNKFFEQETGAAQKNRLLTFCYPREVIAKVRQSFVILEKETEFPLRASMRPRTLVVDSHEFDEAQEADEQLVVSARV